MSDTDNFQPGFGEFVNALADLKHDPEFAEAILASWPQIREVLRLVEIRSRNWDFPSITAAYAVLPRVLRSEIEGKK